MSNCHLCRQSAVDGLLDFGPQPVRNRFLASPGEREYTHPLAVGCCRACGTVQLDRPAPAEELRPRFDWIAYNEPENHLDALADDLCRLPGLTPESVVCGISRFDDSTLRRLRERGFRNTWRIDPLEDLGIHERGAGTETLQQRLTPQAASTIAAKHGRPDVVVMRYVLEHAQDIHALLWALRTLAAPRGLIVIEIPDTRRALEKCDYTTVWEEHVFYFTPATLKNCFALAGFECVYFRSFPSTAGDSLVAVVRAGAPRERMDTGILAEETERADRFLSRFRRQRERYRSYFAEQRRQLGKIAFLGAGHLSAALLNLFGLSDLVEFVADDNPHKKGMYMPGSRLPILGTDALVERGVKLCCMSVRPEIEDKVIANNRPYLAGGGALASIFPDSRYALAI
jgi:hypothetical protein